MAFRSVGLLNVPYSTFAGPSLRAPCIRSHLHCLATIRCAKGGPGPPLNGRLSCSLVPLEPQAGIVRVSEVLLLFRSWPVLT